MPLNLNLLTVKESGIVSEIRQDVVSVTGLSNCMNGQMVQIEDKARGFIVGFDPDYVLVLMIHVRGKVKPGDKVTTTLEPFKVAVGPSFMGRRVNALCESLDGQGMVRGDRMYPIFNTAPTVLEREPLCDVLQTGTKSIDMTLPIGKGQRMLILGDRMTGKTTVGVDAIVNQRGKDVICIYCAIGKAESAIDRVVDVFDYEKVWEYGLMVTAGASDSMGQQYLVPYVACSIGEYFMYEEGKDVLVVFDDFTKHAWAYRQISLLLERAPGRDAYPGDIFYIHSQLVERAGKPELGGGSMTHLPIVETQQGDFAGYIPSNIISMTDGQIFLNSTLFGEGFKPAVDMGLSVSRIGSKVQWSAMKKPTSMLKIDYVRYRELEKLTRIKAGGSADLEARLNKGKILEEVLKQKENAPVPMEDQVLLLFGLHNGLFEGVVPVQVRPMMARFMEHLRLRRADLVEELVQEKRMSETLHKGFLDELNSFKNSTL
ncbi:MAG: F0F1 ATP synthase subunit alpha [Kiritimatiellia bacterium]